VQDHLFDVITNVIGLVAALLATYVQAWIDPVRAIIVSDLYFCIIYDISYSSNFIDRSQPCDVHGVGI